MHCYVLQFHFYLKSLPSETHFLAQAVLATIPIVVSQESIVPY